MSDDELTIARNSGWPSHRFNVLKPTPAAAAASFCVPPERSTSAAASRCLTLEAIPKFYFQSGNWTDNAMAHSQHNGPSKWATRECPRTAWLRQSWASGLEDS